MPQQYSKPIEIVRRMLPFSTAAAILALLYLAWVFYSRARENREWQRRAEEKQLEQDRKYYEMYGSGHLKIMLFYAVPPVIAKGEAGQLCYSVSNATAVKIDNGVEDIRPSLSRCVPIKPAHSTSYTLSASDDKGNRASQAVAVEVR